MQRLKKQVKRGVQMMIPERYVLWAPRHTRDVFVTFDDGPCPEHTPRVLDMLEAANAKATFFLVGERVLAHRSLTEEILARGHSVGSHTFSHISLRDVAPARYDLEVRKGADTLSDIAGHEVRAFRPPWGLLDFQSFGYLMRNNFQIVMWTLDSMDYERVSTAKVVSRIEHAHVAGGDIVLFHDDNEYTTQSIPSVLRNLHERGFGLSALSPIN